MTTPTTTQLKAVPKLTQKQIARGATNDPSLSERSITLGDREFKLVDLQYDSYITFLSHLKPLADMFMGKLGAMQGLALPDPTSLNAASLISYCAESLPEMVCIVCRATDPTVTVQEVKDLGKNPFKLATIVLAQIEQNKMVADFAAFFQLALPMVKNQMAAIQKS